MDDTEDLKEKIEDLKTEHRDLDVVIEQLSQSVPVDFLRLQRLKKRKLMLKDQILKLESMLLPDIIAWFSLKQKNSRFSTLQDSVFML